MARTHNIKFILYTEQVAEKTIILDRISSKAGIDSFVEYLNPQQLVNAANEQLKHYVQE